MTSDGFEKGTRTTEGSAAEAGVSRSAMKFTRYKGGYE